MDIKVEEYRFFDDLVVITKCYNGKQLESVSVEVKEDIK